MYELKRNRDKTATTPGSKKQNKNLSEDSLPKQLELFRTISIPYQIFNKLEKIAPTTDGSAEKLAVDVLDRFIQVNCNQEEDRPTKEE